jgi:4-alpha-glucanotransferase
MKIHFYLKFFTKFGQSLSISGSTKALGDNDVNRAFPLSYLNHDFWHGEIEADPAEAVKIQYKYVFRQEDGTLIVEGDNHKQLDISKSGVDEIEVFDTWCNAGSYENAFYTDPFQRVLLNENRTHHKVKSPKVFTHIFKVKAPLLKKNEVVCLFGSSLALGNWDPEDPTMLGREDGWWNIKMSLPQEDIPLTYKYGIYNIKEKSFVRFEVGENRLLQGNANHKKLTVLHDGFVRLPNDTWKGAGVSIPVFSLRSKDSFGVGEFTDLRLLVDWVKKTGLKLIQILPVNDTTATHTWADSYPYASISAFALHPIYLNLETVAGKKYAGLIKLLKKKQKQLNELSELDYEQVMKFKLSTLKELFLVQKQEFLKDEGFLDFFKMNKHWLVPYASFCYLRDRNGTSNFNEWKLYSKYDKQTIEKYVSPKAKHYDNIALQYFIQYHLHLQLQDAVQYAHKNGIILKGDIPIGIYRYGCDAWVQPELFHFDVQAGAPPDDFAVKGQNWGFPTYNWEQMAVDHFEWWHQRFIQMSNYFDAFRIDHILGFFRIWSIPTHAVEGLMGHFIPALPVHIHEFSQNNIWFNYHRYCKPYITDAVLWEMFGPNNEKFRPFLNSAGNHSYELKEEFTTQRQVEEYFSTLEQTEENKNIQQGLFDLITNVILFEHPGSNGQQFHFRISMEKSNSFRHLDSITQDRLKDLYVNYFYHRQDNFWKKEAMKKLSPLKSETNMLVCGEDLGMVPHSVPEIMKLLGILSLEIQRMPKDLNTVFFHPSHAPYLSVVTPSTHDMSTIRGWWEEEDRNAIQNFYNNVLAHWGDAPATCEPWINTAIINQHLCSPAMWSVFQLQDLLGMNERLRRENPADERINVPANPKHYWKYRVHVLLEDLIKEKEFNDELRSHVEASGR